MDSSDLTGIDKSNPQTSTAVNLASGELAHVSVEKTDAGTRSRLVVRIQGRVDATEPWAFVYVPGVGVAGITLRHDDDPAAFAVTGLFQFRIHLQGTDDGDTQTATVAWKLDGVDLAP